MAAAQVLSFPAAAKWVMPTGYTLVPNELIDRLLRCLTYSEFGTVLILLRKIGSLDPELRGWTPLPEKALAKALGITLQAAFDAKKSLAVRRLVESKKVGRLNHYRVLVENLELVEERPARSRWSVRLGAGSTRPSKKGER